MRVALTGITGHVGAAVAHLLHARGVSVRALLRGELVVPIPVEETVRGDVLEPNTLPAFLEGCDALIHCAGQISIQGDPTGIVRRTNVDGTGNILRAAMACGVRRAVHVSSIHAFEQLPVDQVLDERRSLVGANAFPYDRSKRDSQLLAVEYNCHELEIIVMNPTAIIGPYDYKISRMGKVILQLLSGKQKFIIDGGFDFCDVRDVALALVNGLDQGVPGETYLLSGRWCHLKEVVETLSEVTGKRITTMQVPMNLARAGLPLAAALQWFVKSEPVYTQESLEAVHKGNRLICSDKAIHELGYSARSLADTLQDTWLWFRDSGYLGS